MPWTPAHAAAVLPLRRFSPRWLSFPGLVLGSMSPDFGYYVGALEFAGVAHSWMGLLSACLPSSLGVLLLVLALRRLLCAPLPAPHRSLIEGALSVAVPRSVTAWVGTAASIVIGAATHVVWDAFTHEGRWGVALFPVLDTFLFSVADWRVHLYKLVQHLSTLLGVVCLVVAYRRAMAREAAGRASSPSEQGRARALVYLLVAGVVAGAGVALAWTATAPTFLITKFVFRAAVCSTTLLALGYLALSFRARPRTTWR